VHHDPKSVAFAGNRYFFQIALFDRSAVTTEQMTLQVMPDDHSKSVPPLPIPNRTVKRLRADDSAATSAKVGHRQAVIPQKPPDRKSGGFLLCA
jgi:hypothetical protein